MITRFECDVCSREHEGEAYASNDEDGDICVHCYFQSEIGELKRQINNLHQRQVILGQEKDSLQAKKTALETRYSEHNLRRLRGEI